MAATQSELARVNGLDMYYETVGRGGPLVLLHGALSTIETSFGLVRTLKGSHVFPPSPVSHTRPSASVIEPFLSLENESDKKSARLCMSILDQVTPESSLPATHPL